MALFLDFKRLLPYNVGFGTERKAMELVAIFSEASFDKQLPNRTLEKRCSVSEVVRRAPTAYQDSKVKGR